MPDDISTINRVRFAGLDFSTITDELRARLQIQFAATFNDFSVSSMGMLLLDIISFGLDTLAFYLDRRATDMYLATARTQNAVSLLTRQLGYKMAAAVASSTDLTVAVSQSYAFAVTIPQRFQFQGPNGLVFEAGQAVTIPASSTVSVQVPVYQGQTITEVFTSDGTANQVFQLTKVPAGQQVAAGTVQATVNGASFVENPFLVYGSTSQFEADYISSPPTVTFGDGVTGAIPVTNGSIVVTYVATQGTLGKCLANTITTTVSPLIVSLTPINLTINNTSATVGESDAESLDHAKTYAPLVYKSRNVAITQGDYEALAGSYSDPLYGRVAVAKAINARSSSTDVTAQNLLLDIQTQIDNANTTINTALSDPNVGAFTYINGSSTAVPVVAGVLPSASAISTDVTNIFGKMGSINSNLSGAQQTARQTQNNATTISANFTDASTSLTTAITQIGGFPTGNVSQLASGDASALLTALNVVSGVLSAINSLATTISTAALAQQSALSTAQGSLQNDVGISVSSSGTFLVDITAQVANILAAVGSTTSSSPTLLSQLTAIQNASTYNATQVASDMAAINAHLDEVLAADCTANLVVVPILSVDASGFYASPSTGLIRSLQAYLQGIREVTQVVSVTSGVNSLVPAVLTVRIGVLPTISFTVTQSSATGIIDGILRGRSFGESLYISDLLVPLAAITGVGFVDVTIAGYRPVGSLTVYTDKLDDNGNLIIDDNEIVTLSTAQASDLAINIEVFSPPT